MHLKYSKYGQNKVGLSDVNLRFLIGTKFYIKYSNSIQKYV